MEATWKDYVPLFFGITGTGLGILNFYLTYRKERVRLRLELTAGVIDHPLTKLRVGGGEPTQANALSFNVTNLSAFPVIITEVGLAGVGEARASMKVRTLELDSLPQKVEPRTTLKTIFPMAKFPEDDYYPAVYVATDCGCFIKRKLRQQPRQNDLSGSIYT